MSMEDKLEAIHNDVLECKKALFGNGRKGITERVTILEASKGKVDSKYFITTLIAIGAIIVAIVK